jgi:diguanylate cyclase (GGDEF)-like protein
MITKDFEELKHAGSLPSPTSVGLQILSLTRQPEVSLEELVRVIQVDPALTGQVLRVANSALVSGATATTSVREAAVRLGTRMISQIALGFSVIGGNRGGACPGFDYDGYWMLSLAHGIAAQEFVRRRGAGDPAQAFTCGLLARIGELALASVHSATYAEILRAHGGRDRAARLAAESAAFRMNCDEVTEAVLRDWGLPEGFARAAASFRAIDDLAPADRAQRLLADGLHGALPAAEYLTDPSAATAAAASAAAGRAGLGLDEVDELCEKAGQLLREWGALLGIQVPDAPRPSAFETAPSPPSAPSVSGAPHRQAEPPSAAEVPASDQLLILAVDDDPVSLRLLVHHLRADGHAVITASNGRDALALALARAPHVVMSDWMMPGIDGIDLTRALRRSEAMRNTHVILVTGREEEDRIVEAFNAGVNDYVTKPFKPRVLSARVGAAAWIVRMQERIEEGKQRQRKLVYELELEKRKLKLAAMTDPLTQLPNRRFAMTRLDEEWLHAERAGAALALVMFDIDHFKTVNDGHGHQVGDDVLREVASVLRQHTRGDDVCARIGGEEFLLICRNATARAAAVVGDRVRQAVAALEFPGLGLPITLSAGVAERGPATLGSGQLLRHADDALYDAKARGRNRVVLASGQEFREAG